MMTQPRQWSGGWSCLIAAAVVAAVISGRADGQWAVHAETPWVSDVAGIDADELVADLHLSDEQAAFVRGLLQDHREAFERLAERGRAIEPGMQARLRKEGETELEMFTARRDVGLIVTDLAKQQEKMQRDTMARIAPILSDEQRARWDQVRYGLHRQWWLERTSMLSHEEVDLIALLDALDRAKAAEDPDGEVASWRDNPSLREVMAEWARRADALILRRRQMNIDLDRDWWVDMTPTGNQMDAAELEAFHQWQREMLLLHQQHNDLTRAHQAVVMGHLNEDDAAAFERLYLEARWSYQGTNRMPGIRFAEMLLADDTLDPDTRNAVQALVDTHRPVEAMMLDQLARAWDDAHALTSAPGATRATYREAEQRPHEVKRRYYDLDDQLIKSVWSVLSPAEQARRTRPEPRNRTWMDRR